MYKVAICDDNPADLQLITDYLTEPEFHYPLELSSFHDGVELAQAYKKEGQFDLIILDMMMDRLKRDRNCLEDTESGSECGHSHRDGNCGIRHRGL